MRSECTLNALARDYFAAQRRKGVKTVEEWASVWERCAAKEIGKLDPHALTVPKLARFLERKEQSKTPSIALKLKKILSAALRFARIHREDCADLATLPTTAIPLKAPKPRSVCLSPGQIARFLQWAIRAARSRELEPSEAVIVACLYGAARISEIVNLRRDAITMDDRNLSLALHLDATKNGSPHTIFLFGFARDLVWSRWREAKGARSPIWPSPKNQGKPISRQLVFGRWKEIQKELGFKGFTLHDLRRSAATLLANDGETLENVELLLNHSILTRVQAAYFHVHEQRLIPIFARLADLLARLAQTPIPAMEAQYD